MADERNHLTGIGVKADVLQHRLAAIGERNITEIDLAVDPPQCGRVRGFANGDRFVEQLEHLLSSSGRRLELVVELGQRADRLEETGDVRQERDEHAQRHLVAVDHQPAAVGDHRHRGRRVAQLDHGQEHRRQGVGLDVGDAVVVVHHVELLLAGGLARERLNDAHAGVRLGELARQRGHGHA